MSYYLIQQIAGHRRTSPSAPAPRSSEAHGDGHLEQLRCATWPTGTTEIVDAGQLFIFIGAAPRNRLAGRRAWPATSTASSSPARTSAQEEAGLAARPPAVPPGDQRPRRVRGRRRARPSRPSGSPRRWARARWPSCSCTGTWRTLSDERHDSNRAMRPGGAAHAVPVREAHRRAARPAVQRGPRRGHRARPGLRRGRPRREPLRADRGHLVTSRKVGGGRRRDQPDQPARRLHRRLHGLPGRPGAAGLPATRCGSPSRPGSTCSARSASRRS